MLTTEIFRVFLPFPSFKSTVLTYFQIVKTERFFSVLTIVKKYWIVSCHSIWHEKQREGRTITFFWSFPFSHFSEFATRDLVDMIANFPMFKRFWRVLSILLRVIHPRDFNDLKISFGCWSWVVGRGLLVLGNLLSSTKYQQPTTYNHFYMFLFIDILFRKTTKNATISYQTISEISARQCFLRNYAIRKTSRPAQQP